MAQTGLNTVSNNIADANTAGYVREIVNQSAVSAGGQGTGVTVADITRTTNPYLEAANQQAVSDSSSVAVSSSYPPQRRTPGLVIADAMGDIGARGEGPSRADQAPAPRSPGPERTT